MSCFFLLIVGSIGLLVADGSRGSRGEPPLWWVACGRLTPRWFLAARERRVVGVAGVVAAVDRGLVHLVQRGAGAEPLDDVRVRERELPQRGDVGEPGLDVVGDLLTAASVAHDEDRVRPQAAQGTEQ